MNSNPTHAPASAIQACQFLSDVVPTQLCERNRWLPLQDAACYRLTVFVVLWPRAGGLDGPSGSDAAYAIFEAESQTARDTWRALEALLRLSASDITVGDADMLGQSGPDTYNAMVRFGPASPGRLPCAVATAGSYR